MRNPSCVLIHPHFLFAQNKYQEFFYPALEPGVHYVSLPEGDPEALHSAIFPKMKEAVGGFEVRPVTHRKDLDNRGSERSPSQGIFLLEASILPVIYGKATAISNAHSFHLLMSLFLSVCSCTVPQ